MESLADKALIAALGPGASLARRLNGVHVAPTPLQWDVPALGQEANPLVLLQRLKALRLVQRRRSQGMRWVRHGGWIDVDIESDALLW